MDISSFLIQAESLGHQNEDIKSIILVGSYARGQARADSDIDLVIITTEPDSYINDTAFIKSFGRVLKQEKEYWGRVTSIRAWYDNGLEVEFGVTTPIWCSKPLDAGTLRTLTDGYKVIFDRAGYFSENLIFADNLNTEV